MVLTVIDSTQLTYNFSKYNIAFSKLLIKKISFASKWDFNLGKIKYFKNKNIFPKAFPYHDYIHAWYSHTTQMISSLIIDSFNFNYHTNE